jgi:branched-chain amino acid transport system ATP-binding protein
VHLLLKLSKVTVFYETAKAIQDISMTVEGGTIVSVIGSNGAGKSTIMKAISGLVPVRSGQIEFAGKVINRLPTHQIVDLGIAHVPEGKKLFPYMTVRENINLGAYLRKDKLEVAKDLENVYKLFPRLKGRLNQKAGSLSGGEQQMLAIGRALMTRPKLLMMDEPSLGLAPIIIELLADVINDINKSGISVLLVEQNASLVSKVAQKCYVIETGSVVLEGDIKKLMSDDSVRRAFLG